MASSGLVAASVSHAFGARPVLADVSLAAPAGEVLCLVGPSGCGKTTLLRLVAGLEDLRAGRIEIDGQLVADATRAVPPEQRGIGLVFQDNALFPHLNVADNVAFGLRQLRASERDARVEEVLAQVGMAEQRQAWPHQLSGGQQQRVALARALAPAPRVMLLDEPFANLDLRLREQIRDDTLHVLKHSGAATLMVTHDPEEAMFMADRIAIMRAGRIEQTGTPLEVYRQPVSAFVAGFFGQVNSWQARVEGGVARTPFGDIATRSHAEGAAVEVVIRPEALRLLPPGSTTGTGLGARVMASRLLGRSSWIHLSFVCADASPWARLDPHQLHFHARVHGLFLPKEGDEFAIGCDPTQAFVFAAG
jgi:iron(III) transport system ATP-binding protein